MYITLHARGFFFSDDTEEFYDFVQLGTYTVNSSYATTVENFMGTNTVTLTLK